MGLREDFVQEWQREMTDAFTKYLNFSGKIGGVVLEQSKLVENGFVALGSIIQKACHYKKPADIEEFKALVKPISDCLTFVQEHRDKYRSHEHFSHLSTVSESVIAFSWIAWDLDIAKTVKEYRDAGAYYGNKVIVNYKKKDPVHVEWTNSWLDFLTNMSEYVRVHHRFGLNWNTQAEMATANSGFAAPPPPPIPPPMSPTSNNPDPQTSMSKLLKDINIGADITKGLKHVTKKTPTSTVPRDGNISHSSTSGPSKCTAGKTPKFQLDGRKWIVEFHDNTKLKVEPEMNHTMYAYKCEKTFLEVSNKIAGIVLDSCNHVQILLQDVISSLEIINCKNVKAQTLGKMPTLSVSKSDNVQVYINKEAFDVEIISEKSSEINILVPTDDGSDYVEHSIPEQFKTLVVNGCLKTTAILKM